MKIIVWRICIWIKLGLKGSKGTCDEDILVLSQFCAEVINLMPYLPHTQNDPLELWRRSQTNFARSNNHDNNIFGDFSR